MGLAELVKGAESRKTIKRLEKERDAEKQAAKKNEQLLETERKSFEKFQETLERERQAAAQTWESFKADSSKDYESEVQTELYR